MDAEKLLDFEQKLDINLLDQARIPFAYSPICLQVVVQMNLSTGDVQSRASRVLTQLKEHPDAWTRVDAILEYSQNIATKYFALQILEQLVQTRWKALPRVQCEGGSESDLFVVHTYTQSHIQTYIHMGVSTLMGTESPLLS
jgi:exportin-1